MTQKKDDDTTEEDRNSLWRNEWRRFMMIWSGLGSIHKSTIYVIHRTSKTIV